MAHDSDLLQRLRQGDRDALRCTYEKYKDDLLTIATCLLTDAATAEDCLHDVFVNFVEDIGRLRVRKNLKGYLITSIANRARDQLRKKDRQDITITELPEQALTDTNPAGQLANREEAQQLCIALAQLPYPQREVITLHLHSDMSFKQIARMQKVSINTTQSRYRYGLDKLRTLLKKENKNDS